MEKLSQDTDASVLPLVIYMLGCPQLLCSVSSHQKKQSQQSYSTAFE